MVRLMRDIAWMVHEFATPALTAKLDWPGSIDEHRICLCRKATQQSVHSRAGDSPSSPRDSWLDGWTVRSPCDCHRVKPGCCVRFRARLDRATDGGADDVGNLMKEHVSGRGLVYVCG